jgi:hypothetical protein
MNASAGCGFPVAHHPGRLAADRAIDRGNQACIISGGGIQHHVLDLARKRGK